MWAQNIPVLRRIVPGVHKRVARLCWPNGRGVVRRDGVLYLLNLESENWYDKSILLWGSVEPEQRAFLLDNIRSRKCDTFLDAGANFGTYATYIALHGGCDTIIAFEPDQRSYDRLRANLLINGLSEKVKTRMVAVSDHSGTVSFVLGPDNDASSSEIKREGSREDGKLYTVPCVRLDDELPVKGRRVAIKMDVQFHELTALQGMKALLRDNVCFLQVECVGGYAAPFIAAMKAEGYNLLHQIEIDYYFAK